MRPFISLETRDNSCYSVVCYFEVIFARKNFSVISRNLYFNFIWSVVMRRCALYETHQLETGVGSVMQRAVLKSKLSQVVVISNQLKTLLAKHYKVSSSNFFILRDAAPQNLFSKSDSNDECLFLSKEREKESGKNNNWLFWASLFWRV